MVLLGRYSYGLYLVHQPILYEVHRVLLPLWEPVMGVHAAGILCGLIGLSMAMPLAVVLYHVFELPILGLKRHFKPERPRQSAQEVSMSQASNQAMKNKFKSITGEIYNPLDAQYLRDSTRCHDLCMKLNAIPDRRRRKRRRAMARIFGQEVRAAIRSPFYCDFGTNITLGDGVFISFNCIVLDTARVTIGDRSLFGPGIQILTAAHPTDPDERRTGRISARPITIGADVWVGAGAIICPGVTVGDGAVIGAGSVVTRSIPSNVFAAGNPCRVIRSLRE
jgi:maltose O-acetyltransferase